MTTTTPAYEVRYDAAEATYGWDVIDAEGDVLDSFETKAEAR